MNLLYAIALELAYTLCYLARIRAAGADMAREGEAFLYWHTSRKAWYDVSFPGPFITQMVVGVSWNGPTLVIQAGGNRPMQVTIQ